MDSVLSDTSDIVRAVKPIMPPVSMAMQIPTFEETTNFIPGMPAQNGGIPAMPPMTTLGNSEVTSGIPTGVPMISPAKTNSSIPPPVFAKADDEVTKFGRAYNVAKKTAEKFKVEKVEDFITLVEEIKNNL